MEFVTKCWCLCLCYNVLASCELIYYEYVYLLPRTRHNEGSPKIPLITHNRPLLQLSPSSSITPLNNRCSSSSSSSRSLIRARSNGRINKGPSPSIADENTRERERVRERGTKAKPLRVRELALRARLKCKFGKIAH